ncbi:MAG: cupredoxin domain-containing protein [Rhizobiales bacterium]|nr:cupredoxin domain-containing protein [Hyphomicrobiales bacterium]
MLSGRETDGSETVAANDETPTVEISIENHLFSPAEVELPADQKVKLVIKNLDPTPEEFESHELNREKIIAGNSEGVIYVGPLKAGTYPFYGEFNEDTAQGKIIVK